MSGIGSGPGTSFSILRTSKVSLSEYGAKWEAGLGGSGLQVHVWVGHNLRCERQIP